MSESYIQQIFADRIGANKFGKDDKIYKFEKIKRAKRAALQANPGAEIIDMGVGEPDDMAHHDVVKALSLEAEKWENRQYTDNGIQEFKVAACKYMKDAFNVDVDSENEIIHAIGSKSALCLLPSAFINPGDVTIMTIPGYPVLGTWTKYLGGEVVNLPLYEKNDFYPDLDSLTPDQRKRAKLLYLNYPNNPTGGTATEEFFSKAIRFAKENDILIVSDAAYAPLTFKGKPLSILSMPGGKDCAIELQSMSKGFNMTGWRLSWVCGNALAVKAFAHLKDNADSGQFGAIQKAAIKGLENWTHITPYINAKYERRLTKLVETLQKLGFPARMPKGGFYLYFQIPKAVKNGPKFENAEEFTQWLIKEKLISSVPWDDVGNYARFSATFVARNGVKDEERVLHEIENRLKTSEFIF
ncbi:MAG TPA: LL-diaminopimelate aminotransferase [Lentisphaeria bacterium]|nr:MAG: aspartate aminotransferase [Lentisphaerae bacterium GWF2_38_69]HBM16170.1 LL-diaminopimelate aminotransferase [Lentisphaeria bacterium]